MKINLSRREFCSMTAALGAAAVAAPRTLTAQSADLAISLAVDSSAMLAKVPSDFMGLSYESGQLAYPDFFSPQNTALIQLFRTLSPSGVLRLGGNLSEFTVWSETEPATPPEPGGLVGPDPGHRKPRIFTITPRSIQNLHGFLTATGWRCIYGLNLGGGTLEQALAEGSYVAKTLGPKLLCVQFGNEPDLFKHHDQDDRPWTFDEYLTRWKMFRAAFRDKLPDVEVAGPDTAFNQTWVKQFTQAASKEIVLVTSHYYPEGPPTDPHMNIDLLMHPGARFESSCREALNSAKAVGVPFRMAEGNSCFNAGKPGVSDTFASALWAGDFCLQMAALGCVGVNLHGGANGYYSPIVGSSQSGFTARPEYYGLMLAQRFAGHTLHQTSLQAHGANVTSYAGSGEGGQNLIAIFNKDERNIEVSVSGFDGKVKHAVVERLTAPSISSKAGVTFEGAAVRGNGLFRALAGQPLRLQNGRCSVHVPAYSAALVQLD
jgi:Glycosyl hydrolase family 79 C-terminal beta domain/Glycosyl hydrolase family 79, N-terminal domain